MVKSFQKYISLIRWQIQKKYVTHESDYRLILQKSFFKSKHWLQENFLRNSINYNKSTISSTFFVPVCVIVDAKQLIVQSIMVVRFNFGGYFFQGNCGWKLRAQTFTFEGKFLKVSQETFEFQQLFPPFKICCNK